MPIKKNKILDDLLSRKEVSYAPHPWDIEKVPMHKLCGTLAEWHHEPAFQPSPHNMVLRVRCPRCNQLLQAEEVIYGSSI